MDNADKVVGVVAVAVVGTVAQSTTVAVVDTISMAGLTVQYQFGVLVEYIRTIMCMAVLAFALVCGVMYAEWCVAFYWPEWVYRWLPSLRRNRRRGIAAPAAGEMPRASVGGMSATGEIPRGSSELVPFSGQQPTARQVVEAMNRREVAQRAALADNLASVQADQIQALLARISSQDGEISELNRQNAELDQHRQDVTDSLTSSAKDMFF